MRCPAHARGLPGGGGVQTKQLQEQAGLCHALSVQGLGLKPFSSMKGCVQRLHASGIAWYTMQRYMHCIPLQCGIPEAMVSHIAFGVPLQLTECGHACMMLGF